MLLHNLNRKQYFQVLHKSFFFFRFMQTMTTMIIFYMTYKQKIISSDEHDRLID
jgi:hypothetical protein